MKRNQLETWSHVHWYRLGSSPSQGRGMSTWPLVRERQRAVVPSIWAGLHYICSTCLNTASAPAVLTSSEGGGLGSACGVGSGSAMP